MQPKGSTLCSNHRSYQSSNRYTCGDYPRRCESARGSSACCRSDWTCACDCHAAACGRANAATCCRRDPNTKKSPPANTMVVKVNPLLNPAAALFNNITNDGLAAINFNGTSNGGGNVSINLVNDSIPVDVQRMGDELVIRPTGATIPSRLQNKWP